MSVARTGVVTVGFLLIATVLGGLLAGAADMMLGAAIVGTPLGPDSSVSPVAWTVIAGGLIYGINEVRL